MPIPLYISPNTPLPGPADFTSPIMAAFQMRERRKANEQQAQLDRERMAMQQKESQADRQQRGQEREATNKYNQGMLDLYKGDRSDAARRRQEEAEDKAWAEYQVAFANRAQDPAGLIRAKQRLRALGKQDPDQAGQAPPTPSAPPSGVAPPSTFRTVPLDLGGPLPLRGLY